MEQIVTTHPLLESSHKVLDENIERLVAISPTFRGIPSSFIHRAIINHEILGQRFSVGDYLIRKSDKACDHFFALLHGKLIISQNSNSIATINHICAIGTIGYFTGKRSVDVTAGSESIVLIFKRSIIETWPENIQKILYENIARELSSIIEGANRVITDDGLCMDKIQEIHEQMSHLGI